MNANDGVSSNLESSSQDQKDKKENVANKIENSETEVAVDTDATNCDIKPLEGWKDFFCVHLSK